jgi:hypothetical protein
MAKETDVLDDTLDGFALCLGQVRVPHIEDQYDADLLAAVHGLVLIGIVEYDDLARLPTMGFPTHDELAVLRDDQRQMPDHAHVGHTTVGQ